LERVPGEVRPQLFRAFSTVVREFRFSIGPIPAASELAKYKEILPSAPDRIVTMAENQSAHRIRMEDKVSSAQIRQSDKGQWMAFIIAILFGAAGLWVTLAGHAVPDRQRQREHDGGKVCS